MVRGRISDLDKGFATPRFPVHLKRDNDRASIFRSNRNVDVNRKPILLCLCTSAFRRSEYNRSKYIASTLCMERLLVTMTSKTS